MNEISIHKIVNIEVGGIDTQANGSFFTREIIIRGLDSEGNKTRSTIVLFSEGNDASQLLMHKGPAVTYKGETR